jgi:glutaminase
MPAGDTGPATAWPDRYVSTGHLPAADRIQALVDEAHDRFGSDTAGEVSTVYPALASAAAHLFGVCVVRTDGSAHSAGDADAPFTIMSVAKPFVFALVCEALGAEEVRHRVGVNATGLPFNSLAAIEQGPDGVTNPMVNPGAIATAGLVPGVDVDERWARLLDGLSRFAGGSPSTRGCTPPRRRPTTATGAWRGCSMTTAGSQATPMPSSTSTPGRAA